MLFSVREIFIHLEDKEPKLKHDHQLWNRRSRVGQRMLIDTPEAFKKTQTVRNK